jgi:ATP-binding cassette, subfamily B, bacterial
MHPGTFFIAVGGAAVFALCTVASSGVIRWVIDDVVVPRFDDGYVSTSTVATGVALLVTVGVVRAIGVVIRRSWAGRAQWRTAQTITEQIVDKLQAQPLSWHQHRPTGDLVARAGVDVEASVSVLAPLPFASSTVLLIVVAGTWLVATDVLLGTIAVMLFPVLAGLNVIYQHRVERHLGEAQHHLGRLSAAVHESFDGVMVVKAFGAERREAERLATIAAHLRHARIKAVTIRATFESLLDALPTCANIVLLVLGAWRVEQGVMTVGEVASFVYLFTLLVFPLRLIGFALSELPHSLAGWARVQEILDEPLAPNPARDVQIAPEGHGMELAAVGFSYEPDRPVLRSVSFTVTAGRVIAVVGPTGSGKSTLLQVIAGLLAPSEGTVARQPGRCCLVFQEAFLFGGSVADNVTLDEGYVADDVREALALAEALEFVDVLPAGADTVVGERGVSLSGGQRQRIALARALVRRPNVLLLDDTTSALDPTTEARILGNLRTHLGGVTTLIVASRPSTIVLADESLYVADGRVLAQGPHQQLVEEMPGYRALVEAYEHDRTQSGAAR